MPKFDNVTLTEVLIEMRSKAMILHPEMNELKWRSLIEEYDMLFLGENANKIYSNELLFHLQKRFDLDGITKENLNQLIPIVCKNLNMQCDPMIQLKDIESRNIDHYAITLF